MDIYNKSYIKCLCRTSLSGFVPYQTMEKLVEMDIEVKLHMVSNDLQHHKLLDCNTGDLDIPENSFMSTAQFETNELCIEHLHTDRLDDIRPNQYKKFFEKTSLRKYFSTRNFEVEEMGTEAYQILIEDTANLIKGRFNHLIESVV